MFSKKVGLRVAGAIFGVVAILHLFRLVLAIPITISNWPLPIWVSYLGFVVTTFLCGCFLKLAASK